MNKSQLTKQGCINQLRKTPNNERGENMRASLKQIFQQLGQVDRTNWNRLNSKQIIHEGISKIIRRNNEQKIKPNINEDAEDIPVKKNKFAKSRVNNKNNTTTDNSKNLENSRFISSKKEIISGSNNNNNINSFLNRSNNNITKSNNNINKSNSNITKSNNNINKNNSNILINIDNINVSQIKQIGNNKDKNNNNSSNANIDNNNVSSIRQIGNNKNNKSMDKSTNLNNKRQKDFLQSQIQKEQEQRNQKQSYYPSNHSKGTIERQNKSIRIVTNDSNSSSNTFRDQASLNHSRINPNNFHSPTQLNSSSNNYDERKKILSESVKQNLSKYKDLLWESSDSDDSEMKEEIKQFKKYKSTQQLKHALKLKSNCDYWISLTSKVKSQE